MPPKTPPTTITASIAPLIRSPAAAIDVCRSQAPEIASRLSRQSGANVSRVSSRFRNPQNVPAPWQAESVLPAGSAPVAA